MWARSSPGSLLALLLVLLWPRLGAGQEPSQELAQEAGPQDAAAEPLRVLAASSLTDVMTELARRYVARTGNAAPVLAFSGSSQLVRQINHGDPAHVVLTADDAWMQFLVERGHVAPEARHAVARNRLVVATPVGNGVQVHAPSDLGGEAIRSVAVAAEQVPAGKRAREALAYLGLTDAVAPKLVVARNVRAALALVDRNEVDAAIIYRSDALAGAAVDLQLAFPAEAHADILYPVGLTAAGEASAEARAFVEFIRSPDAHDVFRQAGFDPPPAAVGSADPPPWRHAAPDGAGPFWLTLWVATMSLIVSVVPAVLLGWLLARREFIGKTALSTVLLTPLVLPPVVVGFLLLELLGRNGPFAGVFGVLGIEVAFTRWGAVIAAAVVGFPLLVLMSRHAIEAVDAHYDQVAQTLGLTPFRAFVRVSLPMAAPGLLAGCVLAFARALGEFGATAVLATDTPGQTRTLALAIFALYEQPGMETEAHGLVWISIGVCAAALVAYERLSKIQKARLSGTR